MRVNQDPGEEDTILFSGEISLFSISSSPHSGPLKKRGRRFIRLQKSSQEAVRQPLHSNKSQSSSHWGCQRASTRGPLQSMFVLTCQPLSEIYLQPCSPKSLLPVILGLRAQWVLWVGREGWGEWNHWSGSMMWDWRVSHRASLRVKWLGETSQVNHSQPSIAYICGSQGLKERFSCGFSIYRGSDLLKVT